VNTSARIILLLLAGLSAAAPAAAQYDAPAGYYASAEGLTGPALKTALHNIIDDHAIVASDGGDSFQALRSLDQDPNNSSRVLTVYSGTSEPKFADGGLTWNREHCWPRGYGISATGTGASADESDLFNLRACLTEVNVLRGDRIYDNVSPDHPTDPAVAPAGAPQCLYDANLGQGGLWTPRPSETGDLARAMFYMAVRYDGSDAGTVDLELGDTPNASQAVFGNLKTLLQWHLDDPVSTEERRRNDLIHDNYQGNRNPFVDRPEFVAKIFGAPELTLTMDRSAYDEGTSATATLSLPAVTSSTLNIRIIAAGDGGEISAPSVVTIPAGQASAQFTVSFLADGVADGDQQVGLAVWAEGYKSTFFALAVLDTDGGSVAAAPAIVGAGRYAQNFDALPSGGTNAWSNNTTIAGWIAQRTGAGANIIADAGSSTAGNLYSYGSAGSGERALGSLGSASAGNFSQGVNLQNTSGRSVTLASFAFVGEQWRNSAAAAQSVNFSYRLGSNAVTDLTPTNNAGWTSVTALNFTSPITGGGASSLNGNLATNRSIRQSDLGVTLAPGQWITLRWQDPDHPGTDHGLAIDDLSLDWRVVAGGTLPQWTGAAPPSGRVGDAYSHALTADADPTHYEVEGLPPGLQVNTATGLITGTPTAAGTFNATAYAVNAAGAQRTTLPLVIAKILPIITTPPVASTLAPGQPLSAATLTGGAASVPGNFAFASPATVPPSGVSQQSVVFTPSDANLYDIVTFTIPVITHYGSGFEGLTKPDYATGNVTVAGIGWEFANALIASGDPSDFKNGLHSVRLRGYGTSALTMLADLPGGIGTISFQHRRYATDTQIQWIVEYSTNQAASWTEAGRFTPGENVATFSASPNISVPARLRIRAAIATGASNRRANLDDLVITAYSAPTGMTFGQWSGGLAATPDLVMAYAIGGATNAQSTGEAPTYTYGEATLSIEALVRTNDPALRVTGLTTTDLVTVGWTNNSVTVTDITKKPGDPADTARRIFSTSQGTNEAKFLRLRVELGL
jgi:endonuclease I